MHFLVFLGTGSICRGIIFRCKKTEPELAANQECYRCRGECEVEFTTQAEFETSFSIVMLESPEKTCFCTVRCALDGCDVSVVLCTGVDVHFMVAGRRRSIAVVLVATDGEVKVEEEVKFRIQGVTCADDQVAETFAAFFIGFAFRLFIIVIAFLFAPELVAKTLERKFKLRNDIHACTDFQTHLGPVAVPVVVKSRFDRTRIVLEQAEIIPCCKAGGDNRSREKKNLFEHFYSYETP